MIGRCSGATHTWGFKLIEWMKEAVFVVPHNAWITTIWWRSERVQLELWFELDISWEKRICLIVDPWWAPASGLFPQLPTNLSLSTTMDLRFGLHQCQDCLLCACQIEEPYNSDIDKFATTSSDTINSAVFSLDLQSCPLHPTLTSRSPSEPANSSPTDYCQESRW